MTDAISKFTRQAGVTNSTADKASQSKDSAGRPDQSKASTSTDEVILSKAAESAMKSNDFDSSKVDEIKRQISEGKYPLDSKVIAKNFVALESMID
jgi:negative regulator of flagellin synthesis FlgM